MELFEYSLMDEIYLGVYLWNFEKLKKLIVTACHSGVRFCAILPEQ